MTAIKLALCSALFGGIGLPFLKVSQLMGVNAGEVLIINGVSSALIGFASFWFIDYPSHRLVPMAGAIAFAGLFILNIAFVLTNHSFSQGGLISIIPVITSIAPLISVFIGLVFLNEADKVFVPKLILGALLMLSGLVIVSTSSLK